MYEFDRLYLEKTFGGSLMQKLFYLLDRMKALFKFRDDSLEFLFKVHEREVSLNINFIFDIGDSWRNEENCDEYLK